MSEQTTANNPVEQLLQPQEGGPVPFEELGFEEQMRALYAGETVESEDGGEEPEQEKAEAEEEKEPEAEAELYSEEEFNALDPFEVDPAKLSEAAGAVHRRYMQMYREQILPELEQLRDFRQRVMAEAQRAQAQRDPRQDFLNEVRARALRSLGVQELDELNQEHAVELSRQAVLLQGEIQARSGEEQARRALAQRMSELRSSLAEEFPDFAEVDRFAKAELNNLPYAKAQRVIGDLTSGDPARIRAVYQMFAQRRSEAVKSKEAEAVKKPAAPPRVIGGQRGEFAAKEWSMKDFSGARSDDQARMLVEMGLVEDE